MDIHEIVVKLIGPINPVGETNEDNRRLENLKEMINLMNQIHTDIDNVVYLNKDCHEFSKKKAAELADRSLVIINQATSKF